MSEVPLRAVFVNLAHPDTPHVSGQRFSRFAIEMAARGHQIVLLTAAAPWTNAEGPESVGQRIACHDWSGPLHVAVPLKPVKEYGLPLPFRKVRSVLRLLGDGHSPEWSRGATKYAPIIAECFRPSVVWAVFGSVSDLVVGQLLSREAHCRWMIDFKDNFDAFIPVGIRPLVARRFSDAAGATCNARFHGEIAAKSFPRLRPLLVYSGVAPEMIAPGDCSPDRERFVVPLIGAVYRRDRLMAFLGGLERWLRTLSYDDRRSVEFHYAGTDTTAVAELSGDLSCSIYLHRYLPLAQLGALTQRASATVYISSERTFHHKLLELLASRRPVVAYGGERVESIELAARVSGDLRVCADGESLIGLLQSIWREWRSAPRPLQTVDVQMMTWSTFAGDLEMALEEMSAVSDRHSRASIAG